MTSRKPMEPLSRRMTICPWEERKHQLLWFEITYFIQLLRFANLLPQVFNTKYIELDIQLHPSSYIDWFAASQCVGQNPCKKSRHKHVVITSLVELWTLCPRNPLFLSCFSACWILQALMSHQLLSNFSYHNTMKGAFKRNKFSFSIFFSLNVEVIWVPNLRWSKTNPTWSFVCLVGDFFADSTTVNHQQSTIWWIHFFQPPYANLSGLVYVSVIFSVVRPCFLARWHDLLAHQSPFRCW